MTTKTTGRGETLIQAGIMLAVAGMAGAASFTHVHDWTMHNSPAGIGDWFGWANAMVSELIPLAAGLEARRRIRAYGKAGRYPIGLIVAAVALSLTGQFAEAKPSVSGWLISAVPALGFLALAKLVLTSPRHATTAGNLGTLAGRDLVDDHNTIHCDPAAPVIVPASKDLIPTVPAHLIASARFAATQHQHTTGQPITPADLAARLTIPTTQATELLAALTSDDTTTAPAARINGHAHPVGVR